MSCPSQYVSSDGEEPPLEMEKASVAPLHIQHPTKPRLLGGCLPKAKMFVSSSTVRIGRKLQSVFIVDNFLSPLY